MEVCTACWSCGVHGRGGNLCETPDNNIGAEGVKALGPHLAELNNVTTLDLSSAYFALGLACVWVVMTVRLWE